MFRCINFYIIYLQYSVILYNIIHLNWRKLVLGVLSTSKGNERVALHRDGPSVSLPLEVWELCKTQALHLWNASTQHRGQTHWHLPAPPQGRQEEEERATQEEHGVQQHSVKRLWTSREQRQDKQHFAKQTKCPSLWMNRTNK